MNRDKILIEINVAGVGRSFDCMAPRDMAAKLLCRGFLELLADTEGLDAQAFGEAALFSARTGALLAPEQTLDGMGIDSGDTLYLV